MDTEEVENEVEFDGLESVDVKITTEEVQEGTDVVGHESESVDAAATDEVASGDESSDIHLSDGIEEGKVVEELGWVNEVDTLVFKLESEDDDVAALL